MAAASASPVADEFAVLLTALGTVPDFRKRKGRRHPLPGLLGLVVLGLMANCRSLSAISRYAQIHPEVLAPLGLIRPPSVPTLSRVLAGIDPAAVRASLLRFTQTLLARRGTVPDIVALDGKSLRGVHEDAAPAHLLHVFAQAASLVLDQGLVPSVREEVRAAEEWITTLASQFPGLAVLTADALFAEQNLCAAIVAQDYAYLLRLKKPSHSPRRCPAPLRQRAASPRRDPGKQRPWPLGAGPFHSRSGGGQHWPAHDVVPRFEQVSVSDLVVWDRESPIQAENEKALPPSEPADPLGQAAGSRRRRPRVD